MINKFFWLNLWISLLVIGFLFSYLFASIQGPSGTTFNQEVTSAANAAVSVTISAASGVRTHIQSVEARCNAGTATITISDGGTQKWSTSTGIVMTTNFVRDFNTAWTGLINSEIIITLSACGVANVGTLIVQADRY